MALADEGAVTGPPRKEGVVGVGSENPPVEGYYRGEASLDDLGVDLDELASVKHDGTIQSKDENECVLDVMMDTKPDDQTASAAKSKKKNGLLDDTKERVAKNRRDADKKTKSKTTTNKSSILGSMMVEYNSEGEEVENRWRRTAEMNEEELERRYNLSLSELDSNVADADVVPGVASTMKDDVKVDKAAFTSHQFIVMGSTHNLDDEEFVYGVNNIHSGLVTALGGVSNSLGVDLVAKFCHRLDFSRN